MRIFSFYITIIVIFIYDFCSKEKRNELVGRTGVCLSPPKQGSVLIFSKYKREFNLPLTLQSVGCSFCNSRLNFLKGVDRMEKNFVGGMVQWKGWKELLGRQYRKWYCVICLSTRFFIISQICGFKSLRQRGVGGYEWQ